MQMLKQMKTNSQGAVFQDLAIHPTIKAGSGCNVCEAYLQGLVFSAMADGHVILSVQRDVLDGVAESMGLAVSDVDVAVETIDKMSSAGEKLQLLKDCVCAFKDKEDIVRCFYAQFAEVWRIGENVVDKWYNDSELEEYAVLLSEWTDVVFPIERTEDVKTLVLVSPDDDKETDVFSRYRMNLAIWNLVVWMGENVVRHFMWRRYGDIASVIKKCEVSNVAAIRELHEIQGELANVCCHWNSCQSLGEWSEKVARRMGGLGIILVDFKTEGERLWSLYVRGRNDWSPFELRKCLGMLIVLLICRKLREFLLDEQIDDFSRADNLSDLDDLAIEDCIGISDWDFEYDEGYPITVDIRDCLSWNFGVEVEDTADEEDV